MKLVSSIVGGVGFAVVTSMLALGGCGGDKSAVTGTSSGGSGGTNTGGSTNTNTSAGGNANGGASSGGSSCSPTTVPTNPLMTNFSEITIGSTATTASENLSWGDSSKTLTGGTFVYDDVASDAPTGTVVSGGLEIKASIAAGDYSGFGFYFGPNCGSNACAYSGFSFTILGNLGGSTVDIQMQMTPDYPLNLDNKGSCNYAAADAGQWTYCVNPHVGLASLLTGGITTTAQTVQVPWSALVGGNPVADIDCHQLLGIQLQFNCASGGSACSVDVTIGDLTFYT